MSTPPDGLAGELRTIIFVRGVTSEASSSESRRNPFDWRIGIGIALPPIQLTSDS